MSKLAEQLRAAGFNAIATSEIKQGYSLENPPTKRKKSKNKKNGRKVQTTK